LHAWYDRFDQVRGISPISAALNWFRDVYEGFEYTLARTKVEQLFGIQIFRDASESLQPVTPTNDADEDGAADSGYQIDFNKGPFLLDMDPGDKAATLASGNPASSTTDFLKLMIHVALKSLDIPYSFFDESFTNFYGSRGGLIQYQKACENKISDIQDCLNWWTNWIIGLAVADGTIRLPSSMSFEDITYEHVPAGVPWWDAAKEARGQGMGIAMGVTSPQRVCREVGTDFETNIDEIAQAMQYAKSKGVDLVYADTTAFAPEITVGEPDAK
jgi:capsid protein